MTFAASLSSGETILLTFIGAGFGSFVAVALQAWLTHRGSKTHFIALLKAVRTEIETARGEAVERSSRAPGDLRFDPPYADSAWTSLANSSEVRRLGKQYKPIAEFYAALTAANHRLNLAVTLAQTAATSQYDEVRLEFRNLAHAMSVDDQRHLSEQAPGATTATNRALGDD